MNLMQFRFNKKMLITISLSALAASSSLLISIVSNYILANLYQLNRHSQFPLFSSFIIMIIVSCHLSYLSDMRIKNISINRLYVIIPKIWQHIFSLPMKTAKGIPAADLTQRLIDYEAALSSMASIRLTILLHGITLMLLALYLASCNSLLSALYISIYFIFLVLKLSLSASNTPCINSKLSEQNKLSSFLNETLLQFHKVRTSNAELRILQKWVHGICAVKSHEKESLKADLITAALELLMPLSLSLLIYALVYINDNRFDAYHLLPFLICSGQFNASFEKISSELTNYIHLKPAIDRLQPILNEKPEVSNPENRINSLDNLKVVNISLRDPITQHIILDSVSINLEKGKFIALIGPSGAGKSSILKIILGLETDYTGAILIDNNNIKNCNIEQVRKQFGVVLQSSNLLAGTIFSNIAANKPITLSDAWKYSRLVGLDKEIEKMPMQMYTHISDNAGDSISGGQKQKILIARALASQPKILLLDEATSALDNKSQFLIQQNLQSLKITQMIIAHRHSTIIDADIIYVMERGKIIDAGTYSELSSRKSIFPHTQY